MSELTAQEQAKLLTLVQGREYPILIKVMEQEVLKFREDLINTPTTDAAAVLSNHQQAKAAAMFYARVKARIERESEMNKLDVVNEAFEDISSELLGSPNLVEEVLNDNE